MDLALVIAAFTLGLAGMPHCAAMCGAPCAALTGQGGAGARTAGLGFHLARLTGYAAAGGLAAGGVGVLALTGSAAPLLRPVWTLLHMAALALGLWLLLTGRQPAFMTRIGRRSRPGAPALAGGWQTVATPWTAVAAGSAWVAWPCGLLQSALVVAALGNTPAAGAAAMAAFELASAAGVQATPYLARILADKGSSVTTWAVRLAGLALALGAGWALGHDLWVRVVAYCTT